MNMNIFGGNKFKTMCFALLGVAYFVTPSHATPLNWDLNLTTKGFPDEIQVSSSGSTLTVSGYGTTGPNFSLERARVQGIGPHEGTGVCNNNEATPVGTNGINCRFFFINRNSISDVFDLVLLEFDRLMTGQLEVLLGGINVTSSGSDYWYGRGETPDLEGLFVTDLNDQFAHSRYRFLAHNNPFIHNFANPPSGVDYNWVLFSPYPGNTRILLRGVNGTAVKAEDPIAVSSPATYPLFGLGALIIFLMHRRKKA